MFDPEVRFLGLLFTITTLLAIGLKVGGSEILASLKNRSLMARSLLANFVLVPVVGLVLVHLVTLAPDVTTAILLMAAAPGGVGAIQFSSKGNERDICFAAGLLFVLTVLAVFITPILAKVILPAGAPLVLPYGRIIRFVLLYLLLPLLLGLAIRSMFERAASALAKPTAIVGTLSFVAFVIMTLAMRRGATRAIGGKAILVMLALILISMVIGWLLGGPEKGARRVLTTGTSFRNAPLCLVIALGSFSGGSEVYAVVAYSALMVPPNMAFTIYHSIRSRQSKSTLPKAERQ
jgi:BASS family bile acid:Na+ symporter